MPRLPRISGPGVPGRAFERAGWTCTRTTGDHRRAVEEATAMADTAHPLVRLETGDRLTRQEFHRRYCARSDIKRAELVEGAVYVHSPMRFSQHDEPATMITFWFGTYRLKMSEVR